MYKKYYFLLLVLGIVLTISSCNKGGEPIPNFKQNDTEQSSDLFDTKDKSSGDKGGRKGSQGTESTEDFDVVGGDDNEDDDVVGGDDNEDDDGKEVVGIEVVGDDNVDDNENVIGKNLAVDDVGND